MGSGELVGSKFHLAVSLRYAPEPGEMEFLCDVFNRTSQILCDATDGVLSIGTVEIATHSRASHRADIWIHPLEEVQPNSQHARLWLRGHAMDTSQNYLRYTTLMAHELSHYLFALGDEYDDPSKHCVDDLAQQASLMELYGWGTHSGWVDGDGEGFDDWPQFYEAYSSGDAVYRSGRLNEFCHVDNHSDLKTHSQNTTWGGKSCWAVIADDSTHNDIPYGLSVPARAGPKKRKPTGIAPTVCTELLPVERTLLLVGPGTDTEGLHTLTSAAAFWVDAARPDDVLGINGGLDENHHSGLAPLPREKDDEWRAERRAAIYGQAAERDTHPAEAVRAGTVDVTRDGSAARQQVLLIADFVDREEVNGLLAVLPAVRAASVRLDLVAAAQDADLGVLAEAVNAAGGRLLVREQKPGTASADSAIALMDLAGETRENGAIISVELAGLVHGDRRVSAVVEFEVLVTEGSTLATIGAAWTGARDTVEVEIRDPTGRLVEADGARLVSRTGPYAFAQVEDPAPGAWRVYVTGAPDASQIRPIAHEVNERIWLDVSLLHAHVRVGEPIELRATLRIPQAVPGATLVAEVRAPAGVMLRIPFTEHTGARGDPEPAASYTASIGTREHGTGAYAITVRAARSGGEFATERDAFYRQQPGTTPDQLRRVFRVPAIRRMTSLTAVADHEGRTTRDPIAGWNP